jgi:DedD protein
MGWRFWRRADAEARDAAPSARRGGSGDDNEGGRDDPAAVLRTRARRRLIGAAALLLAVAVVLPMVLDKEPRPVPDAIPIDIPSDKTPFLPRLALPPPPEAGNAPVAPLPDAAPAEEGKGEPAPKADRTETPAKPADKGDANRTAASIGGKSADSRHRGWRAAVVPPTKNTTANTISTARVTPNRAPSARSAADSLAASTSCRRIQPASAPTNTLATTIASAPMPVRSAGTGTSNGSFIPSSTE